MSTSSRLRFPSSRASSMQKSSKLKSAGATRRAASVRPGPKGSSVEDKLAKLRRRLNEIADLEAAGSLLGWDQATYMPPGGAVARGRQGALLRKLAHEQSVDPALGNLIDALEPWADTCPEDSDDASLVRVARRDFEKAIKVPPDYVARANAHGSASYDAWTRARPANDFAATVPSLETTV